MNRLLLRVSVLIATGAAAQAAPSTGARPNILFALADDCSYPHASVYGTPWVQTPHFDRHLGLMLAELERRELTANTIVIATSDNGMPLPRVKGAIPFLCTNGGRGSEFSLCHFWLQILPV